MTWHPPPPSFDEHEGLTIDARQWLPPEPFVKTVATLEQLAPRQWIRLLLSRYPYPLFETLAEWQWQYAVFDHEDGTVEVHIWKS